MTTHLTTPQRRYDLDWLRVLAILGVFVYHSTRFFNLGDWHVKNATTYLWVELLERFEEVWMMPLIFVISGMSLFYALGKGGALKFIKDKVLRLLVPLLVGAFTHASLQVYLERITHGTFSGSYFEFLPHYFDGIYLDVGSDGNFAFAGMHLWYLLVLFVFTIALYPLFRWLRGSGSPVLKILGRALALPGILYLLAIPLVVIESNVEGPMMDIAPGGWGFAMYLAFMISGFVLASYEPLHERIQRTRWLSLGLGVLFVAGYFWMLVIAENPSTAALSESLDDLLESFAAWAWILAFLGFARQHLSFSASFLKYANEAVLPFYILHQTVLLVVGYFILQWGIPDLLKWALIMPVSFIIIMALYEYIVRRVNWLRFLFGMKSLPASPVAQTTRLSELAR